MLRRAWQTKRQIIEQLNKRVLKEDVDSGRYGGGKVSSLSDIEAVGWAKKLHSTMKGIGTDESIFWKVTDKFKECKSCMDKIKIAFKKTYGSQGDLKRQIEGDFTTGGIKGLGGDVAGRDADAALKAWGYIN